MERFKKLLSLVLSLCILASIAVIAAVSVSANAGDEIHRYDIKQVVNSDETQVKTKKYMFYMPDAWRNTYNDSYDGSDLASCTAGIYWWEGSYNCNDYQGKQTNGWPGYAVKETLAEDANIFVADVPEDVVKIVWNNLVDGGEDRSLPVYTAAIQSADVGTESYDPNEDGYGFYPDGVDNFDGMIYVCDTESISERSSLDKAAYKGEWFYYYGNGEYGIYPIRDEAEKNNGVFKDGEFPKKGNEPAVETQPQSEAVETTATISASENKVYFNSSMWKNFDKVFCHIWEVGNDAFFDWQSKKEKCSYLDDGIYYYDIDTLSQSTYLPGGLQADKNYCIIFSADTGVMTYDCTFGIDCVGDTLRITGNKMENAVDSKQSMYEVVWAKNSASYGTRLAITSIGNIVGSKLCPYEKGTEVIGDWLCKYYIYKELNPIDILAKAYPKFGVETIQDIREIYDYILKKETGGNEETLKQILEYAFMKAYPTQSITFETEPITDALEETIDISKWTVIGLSDKTYTGKRIKQTLAVSDGNDFAKFDVLYKNNVDAGKAVAVIQGKDGYTGTIIKTFKIKKASQNIKSSVNTPIIKAKKLKSKRQTVNPITVKNAKGVVKIVKIKKGTDSKIYKKITVNSKTGAVTFKKGKYAAKMYKIKLKITAKGNKNYKSKSITQTVKIKIK